MTLKIISSSEVVFEGEVQMVSLPGVKGRFTVLNNHASIVSSLTAGAIRYRSADADGEAEYSVNGGIVDVDRNVVSVCIY
jgi:F-type H+-transporting ATPase subunit epsilon